MSQGPARILRTGCSALCLALAGSGALAEGTGPAVEPASDWYPSRYGAQDTLGAINNLSADKVLEAARLVRTGKVYALGVETGPDSPAYAPRQYAMTILQLDDGRGSPLGANRATGNDDLMYLWMGIGSQIDGLGHMGIDHVYYNGNRAEDFIAPTGLKRLSIDRLPPIVSRGVLLDMAAYFKQDILPSEDPTQAFPVHPELLAKNGVYILENMDTRALAADGATEFLFVLGQPRFVGAVQAVINPVAIR